MTLQVKIPRLLKTFTIFINLSLYKKRVIARYEAIFSMMIGSAYR